MNIKIRSMKNPYIFHASSPKLKTKVNEIIENKNKKIIVDFVT